MCMLTDTLVSPIKLKVNLTLTQTTKAQMGVDVELYSFLNLGARGVGWSKPHPSPFTPGKEMVPIL